VVCQREERKTIKKKTSRAHKTNPIKNTFPNKQKASGKPGFEIIY